MPVLDKQKLLAFSKKKAATPLAAGALAAKRAQAGGVSPLPGSHAAPPPGAPPKPGTPPAIGKPPMPMPAKPPMPGALPGAKPPMPAPKLMPLKPPAAPPLPGQEPPPAMAEQPGEQHIFELVEDAAQAAEGGLDQELEDTIAGTDSKGPQDPPPWALEPEKWAEAAEAVGLGVEGLQEKYEEPFVVTAYLYKLIGGQIQAAGLPGADEGADKPPETDMTKKGAAASALKARATVAKAPPPQAG